MFDQGSEFTEAFERQSWSAYAGRGADVRTRAERAGKVRKAGAVGGVATIAAGVVAITMLVAPANGSQRPVSAGNDASPTTAATPTPEPTSTSTSSSADVLTPSPVIQVAIGQRFAVPNVDTLWLSSNYVCALLGKGWGAPPGTPAECDPDGWMVGRANDGSAKCGMEGGSSGPDWYWGWGYGMTTPARITIQDQFGHLDVATIVSEPSSHRFVFYNTTLVVGGVKMAGGVSTGASNPITVKSYDATGKLVDSFSDQMPSPDATGQVPSGAADPQPTCL